LVVIDTGLSPTMVSGQRELVEEELGRSDFRFLINTHMHNDHAFANQVFPEATVVGPEGGEGSLRREIELMPELLERLKSGLDSYGEWAEETFPDSVDGKHAREAVAAFTVGIADLEAGIQPGFPTLTFKDRHTVHMGDLRLELFESQGLHSDSDIMILVPEERVLFTGDILWGGQLPLLRTETRAQFERLLHHWEAILGLSPDLETIIPGHSDVPLSVEQFRGMYLYLSRLWADVRAAREADTSLLRFMMGNVFSDRYPEVANFNFVRGDYNLHQHNIYVLWELMEE
jgi:glyoxylase-like metal-dependent hydrolase (beta-lactamase superfamily II)